MRVDKMGRLLYLTKGDKKMLIKRMEQLAKKKRAKLVGKAGTSKTLSKVI